MVFRKNNARKVYIHVKKNGFHKSSITEIEEIKSFDQSSSSSSFEMTLALSIPYFFGIEEENVKKSRIL
jgi:hypothetical protein